MAQYICTEYQKISGDLIDEMKLHKLLYFTQRESLAIMGEPMFLETFEGWKYGPVNREVRRCFDVIVDSAETDNLSLENAYIAKNIILQYGSYKSFKLRDLSHEEISWKNSRRGIPSNLSGNVQLKLDDIRMDAQKVRPYDSIWDMYYDEFEDAEVE